MNAIETTSAQRKRIAELLVRGGMEPKLAGFGMLIDAAELFAPHSLDKMTDIYAELGKRYCCRAKNVCAYITYAISRADGLAAVFNEMFGTDYEPYRMENKLVVAMLSLYGKGLL